MVLRVGVYLLLGARLENILLFFAVPGLLSSFQLFYFGTFLPHRHLRQPGAAIFADQHRARSNQYGYLASLLTCFHFGYHHEHHDHPREPWWRLPATRAAMRR
jgi:beta-carotene ketolase (CrtW type)